MMINKLHQLKISRG